ncbi:WD40 repeat domain-containing protein, partial [Sansalvadorimonas verongulae]|uniref:WD40 repeat domain-containing protein n=1 Tax=Sansalvadorimonas verongulae TaxID=2172824 RepID=UPI002E32B267
MIAPPKSGGLLMGNGRKKPLSSILQEKATIQHSRNVTNTSFSPDGTHFVSVSNDHTVKIWILKSKE